MVHFAVFRLSSYCLALTSSSGALDCIARRAFCFDVVEKTLRKRRFNPRDQFGTLKRSGGVPQTEKLDQGFENPWLTPIRGEELLQRETERTRHKWEMNADRFEKATVYSLPFRAQKKFERQKRKELREYRKTISTNSKNHL